jgi:hypothetical protein
MAMRYGKTEHAGHKGSGRKSGFWGKRAIAKEFSRKGRRRNDDRAVVERSNEMVP